MVISASRCCFLGPTFCRFFRGSVPETDPIYFQVNIKMFQSDPFIAALRFSLKGLGQGWENADIIFWLLRLTLSKNVRFEYQMCTFRRGQYTAVPRTAVPVVLFLFNPLWVH